MLRLVRVLGKGLLVGLCLAYPWLARRALLDHPTGPLQSAAFLLAITPLILLLGWVLVRSRRKLLVIAATVVMGAAAYALYRYGQLNPRAAFGIPHFAVNLFLLIFFGRTLVAGQEPLITRCARFVHGTLRAREAAYTRHVTVAWCIYFGAQIVVSVLLFEFASISAWSLFINFLSFPLLMLMFIGEYVVRKITQPNHPHVSILKSIQAFKASSASQHSGER